MKNFYLRTYERLPGFLKRRINPLEFAVEDFVRGAALLPQGSVVLDAGAGEARFNGLFRRQLYVAIDSAVGDSSWDYSRIHVLADLSAIPLAGASADAVLNTQVLEHVKDPGAVLAEIYRVLKPGGALYLTAPQGWHEHQQPNDYFRFTRYALDSLLRSVGFREISIQPLGGYFHYLGQRLTYVPKIVFEERAGTSRVLLFPLELATLSLTCFVGPILCYYLDRLDRKKEFTLCYRCLAVK